MIAIIDYGSGNIQAIKNIYKRLKVDCEFVNEPTQLNNANKIILPGVGAFDEAMQKLDESGMRDALNEKVIEKEMPVLGVCVGMQIMATSSDEGGANGLGWFDATVRRFDETKIQHKPKLPHMGWNSISVNSESTIFNDINTENGFYFLHSYYIDCSNNIDILAQSSYGENFTCAINKKNIYGFQFHPEKSHSNGVSLFKNFAELS